jgi:hypothetical protein
VEGKLFLVPVPGDLEEATIGWLAKETSKRYYRQVSFIQETIKTYRNNIL